MYSFLVLGMIPGTNIQISFIAWTSAAALLLSVVTLLSSTKRRRQMRIHMRKIEAFNASLRKLDGELGS